MIHFHAPNREDNVSGPRQFAYLAEVDILGWKFRSMKDGSFVIDTPIASDDLAVEGRGMICILGREHKRLIEALLALDPDLPPAVVPDTYTNVARVIDG